MTDNLVQRLRMVQSHDTESLKLVWTDLCGEAADRIEALERNIERNDDYWDRRVKALEAALRIIAGYEQCIDNTLGNVDIARCALESKP